MEHTFSREAVFDAAAQLYVELGWPATLEEVADKAGADPAEVRDAFSSPGDLLAEWYAHLTARCGGISGELAGETAEERIGGFCFVMLDLLEEHQAFVEGTFERFATGWNAPYRHALAIELKQLLETPDVPGMNQAVLTFGPNAWMAVEVFIQLMRACLADTTPGRERSSALLDKTVRFYAELASNKATSRGVELARYAVEASYLPRIPWVSDWLFGTANPESSSADQTDG